MTPRTEAATLINKRMNYDDTLPELSMSSHHYGKQELKELMDLIYEGPPSIIEEELTFKGNNL